MNVLEMIPVAQTLRPTGKVRALEVLVSLIEADNDTDGKNRWSYLELLRFFYAPPPMGKYVCPEQWVAAVVSKDVDRPNLMHIYSAGDEIAAIDGHRLHIFKTSAYPSGFYMWVGGKLQPCPSDDMQYPEYRMVVPSRGVPVVLGGPVCSLELDPKLAAKYVPVTLDCNPTSPIGLRTDYLNAAMLGATDQTRIYYEDPLTALRIEHGDGRTAIIMLIKLDKGD